MFVLVIFIGLIANARCVSYFQPEQIHLSYPDDPTQMTVTWSTMNDTNSSICEYGSEGLNQSVEGSRTLFVDGGPEQRFQYIHRATMTNLTPGQTYWYHVGSDLGWSELFFFKAVSSGSSWSPSFAIYGDMGNVNAQSLPYLQEETQRGDYDMIIHVGDFAYDLSLHNGETGNEWLRQIEPVAGYVPYMTCVGNHETYYNFSHYKNRFTMPQNGNENMFFSFNVGPVHFLSFSTEYYYDNFDHVQAQFKFLEQDLLEANRAEVRSVRPWIISFAHRPFYCSNEDLTHCVNFYNKARVGLPPKMLYGVEKLFHLYGVDLHFAGHEHSYERFFPLFNLTVLNGSDASEPYTDPKATVHVTTGSAGCIERHAPFGNFTPSWSAFHSTDYGYTRMHVLNATHLYLEQVSVDQAGQVIDTLWLKKSKHGPYPQLFPEEDVFLEGC